MTAERDGLAEIAGVLADSIGSELYASLMEASAHHWRRWDYMTDAAKEKYRAEGARIVAEAVTPALADLLAARDRRVRAEAVREARAELDQMLATYPQGGRHTRAQWATGMLEMIAAHLETELLVCDHPGLDHDAQWSYCWPCPKCGVCKFIGHGPLCIDCATAPIEEADA